MYTKELDDTDKKHFWVGLNDTKISFFYDSTWILNMSWTDYLLLIKYVNNIETSYFIKCVVE